MANKYLSITVGDRAYNLGLGNKLGVNTLTGKLVAPQKTEDGGLQLPPLDEETQAQPLNKDNTSNNQLVAIKGSSGGPAFSLNRESLQHIDESLSGLMPEGFSIDLNSALLLFNKRPKNNSAQPITARVLGASFGAKVDFSRLPFLGSVIPPGYELSIDNFQMVLASASFNRDETFALKHIIPPETVNLPACLNQGANLSIELSVGGSPVVLDSSMLQVPALPSIGAPAGAVAGSPSAFGRPVGLVNVDSISLGYSAGRLQLLVDGAINVSGFSLGLMGLAITIPLEDIIKPRLDRIRLALDGLSLRYDQGFLSVSGALLRSAIRERGIDTGRYEYAGQVSIRTAKLGITGIGCYTELPSGGGSAFIYASVLTPLGGIPELFVEGLALGMGYNRGIKVPPIEEINRFPLVTALYARNRRQNGLAAAGPHSMTYVKQQFALLGKYLPAVPGQSMVAVGLKVSTYQLVHSIAVLMVEFGKNASWHVVGTSYVQLPPLSTGLPALGCIEMAFKSVFDPEKGLLGVDGRLTENSFLLTPDCRLTGGFAFYTWYRGDHAGDFVVSLGGYHPKFNKPAHFPVVPRLQFGLDLGVVRFKGQMYSALTSSAIMAGGRFEGLVDIGIVSAQFVAAVDFIVSWLPFYYDARFSVSVAVKVDLLFDIKGEIATDLHIWGPEFSGRANVDFKIYSASFEFGAAGGLARNPVDWNTFNSTFLPARNDILRLHITRGKLSEVVGDDTVWMVVEPDEFELTIDSQLPVNQITTVDSGLTMEIQPNKGSSFNGSPFDIAPMDAVSVNDWNMNMRCDGPGGKFAVDTVDKPMPLALWGDNIKPDISSEERSRCLLTGAVITALPVTSPGFTESVAADQFESQDVVEDDPHWQWGEWKGVPEAASAEDRKTAIQSGLQQPAQTARRKDISDFFGHGDDWTHINAMAADLDSAFIGAPQIIQTVVS